VAPGGRRYAGQVVCARCGHANQPEARFCSSCGASLEVPADESTLTLLAVEAAGVEDELAAYLEGLPPGVGLLVVRHGPNVGSSFRLDPEHTNVGRHPDSEIFLDDITVSRRHVVLDRTPAGYQLRDVGSLNGTYVNRERVDEANLRHGDELQVGRYRLSFVLGTDGGHS
jgi:Inner membrane component of T3SS, cytoplasmic domain/zinc-ribbon domain